MRYETPNYARLFRDEANDVRACARKNGDAKKHLRDTLTEVMNTFKGDLATQKMILEVVHKQGHDGHLIRRLRNTMDGAPEPLTEEEQDKDHK